MWNIHDMTHCIIRFSFRRNAQYDNLVHAVSVKLEIFCNWIGKNIYYEDFYHNFEA